jgi:ribosomal protein L11 methyltransferase
MDYYQYRIACAAEVAEILPAFLAEADFDTFEEYEDGLLAYLPAQGGVGAAEALLTDLQTQFAFTWERVFIAGQNWNTLWESNFQPVVVHDFCAVRADFHAPIPGVRWDLVINPKMAFGTGHHETTWQCIAAMETLPIVDSKLLDFGCGTGILAILASKIGASQVEAVDIEEESYRNTLENCAANAVENVTTRWGTLMVVEGADFDGILANINRHIILDSLPALFELLRPGGWLLVSGILAQDETIVCAAAEREGFEKKAQTQKGDWLCIKFIKA